MAVDSKDIPIDRDMAQSWLDKYDSTHADDKGLKDFLIKKIDELNLDTVMVDTSQRDDFVADETHVVDMIIADLPSYARHQKSTA